MPNFLECSNSNGLLLHNVQLPEQPLRVIIRDYMEDIIILYDGATLTNVNTIPSMSLGTDPKVVGVYTHDLKLKYFFYVTTDVIDVKSNQLFVHASSNSVFVVNLDNIMVAPNIILSTVLTSDFDAGLKIFAYNEAVYQHTFKKILVYQDRALLCLDEKDDKSIIYYIDIRDITSKRKYIYSTDEGSDIYDFQIDDDKVLVLFNSTDADNHLVIGIFDETLREVTPRIDLTTRGMNTRNISVSKEFDYDFYRSYIIFIDMVSSKMMKCNYSGEFSITDDKPYLFNNILKDINGQEYQNKTFSEDANNSLFAIKVKLVHKITSKNIIETIYIPYSKYITGEQLIGINLNNQTGSFEVYFNGELLNTLPFDNLTYDLDISVGPQYSIGQTTYFNNVPLNTFAKLDTGYITKDTEFNYVRIFGKDLNYTDMNLYVKEQKGINDMFINVPIEKNGMFDTIDRFFKFKGQNHKTTKFNIVINTNESTVISDAIKNSIETSIKNELVNLIPTQTDLNEIIWQ